jgi:hypothetical protein
MKFENYTSSDRQDDILDKISKIGIDSLTKDERDFLDSFKTGDEEKVHKKMLISNIKTFVDDWNFFEFKLDDIINFGDKKVIKGLLSTPDLEFDDENFIEGELKGEIVVYTDGQISLNFTKLEEDPNSGELVKWDVFDFCNGIEYELDSFIDYVVEELDKIDI